MSGISRLGSFSTSNLPDTREVEVKPRRYQYGQDEHAAHETYRDPLHRPAWQLPTAARYLGNARALQLRRSVSMQDIGQPESRTPRSVQDLLKSINTLNDHIIGIRFKPDHRRRQIRREVMHAHVHEFTLDKALERVLNAMYKTKNDLKEEKDRASDEDVFRRSVEHAVLFGRPPANATVFTILKDRYKKRQGMGDTAAGIAAGASMLTIPVTRAAQKLAPNFILQRMIGNQRNQSSGEPPTLMHAVRAHRQNDHRGGPVVQRPHGEVDIDALFCTPRESMAANNDEENVEQTTSPAAILEQIGTLVREHGASAALAAMDIDDALVLCEFNGGIDHLGEVAGTRAAEENKLRSSTRPL